MECVNQELDKDLCSNCEDWQEHRSKVSPLGRVCPELSGPPIHQTNPYLPSTLVLGSTVGRRFQKYMTSFDAVRRSGHTSIHIWRGPLWDQADHHCTNLRSSVLQLHSNHQLYKHLSTFTNACWLLAPCKHLIPVRGDHGQDPESILGTVGEEWELHRKAPWAHTFKTRSNLA